MQQRYKNKIKDSWNRLRAIPIEWDLAPALKVLHRINQCDLSNLLDLELKALSARLQQQVIQGQPIDDLLVKAFAVVRETAWRTLGLRPFEVQILAGIVMHQGKLAELSTGEGKTLVAVFPAYLNALSKKGVHVHTFNDYLARRDAAWMGPMYDFLGISVGVVQQGMPVAERRKAYQADVTYATAKEAGFDFLRDHLCFQIEDLVQRPFNFAIVDEADSILIDEARIPLVIAGSTEDQAQGSLMIAEMVKSLREGSDFEADEGRRNIYLTEPGIARLEETLRCGNLHSEENLGLLTGLNLALHAEFLLHRDIDYIVQKGKIEIVDEFTGRVALDRHWPDGLQAALEAKEKVSWGAGGSVLGSITLQHFLRLYPKLCGMTATAQPAAPELFEFYNLKVVVVPPNRPCIRVDQPDLIFSDREQKTCALLAEIQHNHLLGRPVLVGTASIEESEQLASALENLGVSCQVLNAKHDEMEAKIISQAGSPGAITISTNMAGRGIDIKLGGDREQERDRVVSLGGLYVIGTNRHESLRIDHQLRGRAGRQGDPGTSRFFVSLEDPLIERHGMRNLLPKRLRRLEQKGPISNPAILLRLAQGQRIVEGQNFDIRKMLWKYSALVEEQRHWMQDRRHEVLHDEIPLELLSKNAPEHYANLVAVVGPDRLQEIEKRITLWQMDHCWVEHLALIADLRESIHLVSLGGGSPLLEFEKTVGQAFYMLPERIEDKIIQAFLALPVTAQGVDLEAAGIRGPSSTWTYLINDHQFGFWVRLLKGGNIGSTSLAAALLTPLYLALLLVQRLFRRRK